MDILNCIHDRYSYRGKYLSDPIPREHLTAIMQAGLDAPSGCNKQTVSLIAVDDPALLRQLHAVTDRPLGDTAPAMICVLTRPIIAYRDRVFHVQDYAAAIENMLLAITAHGYASCWVEGYVTDPTHVGDKMAAILGVPEEYSLVAYLPIGIPAEEAKRVRKRPFEDRAWFNGFGK